MHGNNGGQSGGDYGRPLALSTSVTSNVTYYIPVGEIAKLRVFGTSTSGTALHINDVIVCYTLMTTSGQSQFAFPVDLNFTGSFTYKLSGAVGTGYILGYLAKQ